MTNQRLSPTSTRNWSEAGSRDHQPYLLKNAVVARPRQDIQREKTTTMNRKTKSTTTHFLNTGMNRKRAGRTADRDVHGHEFLVSGQPLRSALVPALLGWLLFLGADSSKAQETLTNGALHAGAIGANATNAYTFSAAAGESVVLRVGQLSAVGYFNPWLRAYGPTGVLVGSGNAAGDYAEEIVLITTNSGSFTVTVCDGSYGGNTATGTYQLSYLKLPGSFIVSPADEGGALTNGALSIGAVTSGDLDVWSFTATNGDNVLLRIGQLTATGYFNPWLRVYGPDGALLGSGNIAGDATEEIVLTATNTGVFTVLVADGNYGDYGGTGTYQLNYLKVPANFVVLPDDEGGQLSNGGSYDGTITIGDLDPWSFTAATGDNVVLRVGQVTSVSYFNPWLRVYGPNGALVQSGNSAGDSTEEIVLTATNSGTFTVVVADGNYGGSYGTGTYQLNYAKAPGSFSVPAGDEGGPLANGGRHDGTITVGDLDLWNFTAASGDSLVLRIGQITAVGYFNPWLRVYGPNGALVGSGAAAGDTTEEVVLTATNGGTFTVIAADGNYGGSYGTGDYQLSYIKLPASFIVTPGDDGGTLTNGLKHTGSIGVGDLDIWSFAATNGDRLVLRMGQVSAVGYFNTWMRIYGPNGALINIGVLAGQSDTEVSLTATNTGAFTVIVADGNFGGYDGTGDYELSLAHPPEAVFASPGDEGGVMTNGFYYTGTNSLGDLDVWSFYGTVGDSNIFRIATTNFTPWLRLYGPSGNLLKEAFTASGANRTNFLSYVVTNNGDYTLVLSAYYLNQSGTYGLKQSRVPPDLNVPATQIINEGDTLSAPLSAQDPDFPDKALTFSKVSAPAGIVLNPGGNTNATILWPTDETSGPSTNTIIVSVTDNVGGKDFIRTNSFIVIVNEVNEPPVLTVPGPQVINELTPLNVSASAADPDFPTNVLKFSLLAPPPGMTIDTNTGAISWIPSESQGSNSYTIIVVVTDTNPPAVNEKELSTTNAFTVLVREVNVAPQLTVPGPQTITELTPLGVSASATDADSPMNVLTYALVAPPTGMTINTNTGAIAWIPGEGQGSNFYSITVMVTDNNPLAVNPQQLSDTKFFTVTVNESNSPPRYTSIPTNQIITELSPLSLSVAAADDDLPANTLTYALVSPPSGMNINSNSGAITWTPTEAQGSNFYTITLTVSDTNANAINQKQFTITTNFTVTVNESNSPPVLTLPGPQTLDELTPLNVSVSATDSDSPANPLTYALVSPPLGMNINSNSGAITWIPTEAQGSNLYTITVTATDTNRDAGNQKQFTVTNTFLVTVNESNSPPVLQIIGNQSLHYGVPLSIQAVATDADLPTNTLVFTLDLFPSNMTIHAASGVISWTPVLAQFGTNTATVRVTDNGVPPRFDTKTFAVVVTGNQSGLAIAPTGGNLKQIIISGDVGLNYDLLFSTNLVNWEQLIHFNLSTSPYPYIDPASATAPKRFYRLKLSP